LRFLVFPRGSLVPPAMWFWNSILISYAYSLDI
jgi:hypothetical protein